MINFNPGLNLGYPFLRATSAAPSLEHPNLLGINNLYEEELARAPETGPLTPFVDIYNAYQTQHTTPLQTAFNLHMEAKRFHEAVFPKIKNLVSDKNLVKEYQAALKIYRENPHVFYAYNQYSLLVNELLQDTLAKRTIISFIEEYKAKASKTERPCKIDSITFEESKHLATYSPTRKTINISHKFFDESLSKQAFTLLHELTHSQQTYLDPMFYPDNPARRKRQETEADRTAASQMQCETCLKVVKYRAPTNLARLGYLTPRDFDPYIQNVTGQRCGAHLGNIRELEEALGKSNNHYEVDRIDRGIGTLQERLPNNGLDGMDRKVAELTDRLSSTFGG